MVTKPAPNFLISTLTLCMINLVSAQNLVPNPNFETFTSCPTSISQLDRAVPWVSATMATPDYFNSCANNIAIDVPTNFGGGGYQWPLNGNGYAGCYFKGPNNYREYIQVQLAVPLEAGICYNVGFFMNRMNQYCGVNHAGIYISSTVPSSLGTGVLPVQPQIEGNGGFYSDTVTWVEISGLYPAMGGEQYITIGNFKDDAETPFDPTCVNPPPFAYYYIDSVYVIEAGPVDELPLDLGPDVEACDEYEIDGESGDVNYYWSDGSNGHTTTASTTDMYSLTITSGCAVGIDSIEVTIINKPPVEINPGMWSMCEGESYTITLDPDAGDYTWNDGSNDNEYTITESGTYSVTLDDGCDLSSDDITVEVTPLPPPIDVGNDITLCEGDEFEISLDPGTDNIAWQDGSNSTTYTISNPGTYSVTISNVCGEISDEIIVTGLQAPQINLGPDTVAWCEGNVIEYDFDPDLGDFLWSDDSDNPTFFIFTSGIYSVTVSNECGTTQDMVTVYEASEPNAGLPDTIDICASALPITLSVVQSSTVDDIIWSTGATTTQIAVAAPGDYAVTISNVCYTVSDTVNVNIIPSPVVILPDTNVMCLGDTLLLDANVPSASYLWQDGSTLSTLEVTGPGVYAVTVTTSCGADHDSTQVTAFPTIDTPDLGPDVLLCSGEQVTLFANATNVTFQWNDLSTADSLLITTPGVYSVTVQDQCTTAADTILITANNLPPVVDLPSSIGLCQGQSIIVDANVSGVNYLWNDSTTNSSLTITAPGSYSVTVSNACGSDMDTVLIADAGTLPVIDLGNDIELCQGESQIIAPDFSSANSWMWQDGSTGPTFSVNGPGQFTIEVSNVCGLAYDTLNAVLLPAIPPLDLGNDTALCAAEILVLAVNIPDVSITWSDGSHGNQITVSQTGLYTAEIANDCGVSTDTLIVTPLPDVPQLSLGPDQYLCPGEVITLDPGISNVQYLWQDGSASSSFSTTQPGLVTLTISNTCGTSTDSLLITISTQGPQLNLGPDVMACDGDTIIIQSGIAGVAYTWQDGSTNSFYKVTHDAQLMLHIANACGVDDDTIAVQFFAPPDPDLGPDTLLCNQDVITLHSIVDPPTTTTWQDGSHASDYVVTSSGMYSLQQSNICGAKTDSIVVAYKLTPGPFSLGPDVELCPGEFVILNAPFAADQILWQDGSDSAMITANKNQVYSLTISNECGSVKDDVNVAIEADMPNVQLDSVLCPGRLLTLDASQPFAAQYEWSTGASNSTIDVVLPGQYAVTVITNCYTISDAINVVYGEDCEPVTQFFIPNVFSPNGDGVNDIFTILFNDDARVISVEGDIFDRWGNHVYYSNQHPFTWDGTFEGKTMNPAVFVYRFTLVYSNGVSIVTEKLTGDVTLIR